MTPEEKAAELVNKMHNVDESFESIGFHEAKQCALIAVDEILHALEYKDTANLEELCFYEEVTIKAKGTTTITTSFFLILNTLKKEPIIK